jgi:1-acyl-sn-glycerol-3-phosphate acyltransferase
MHELSDRLGAGELMCVFPEGTTSNGLAVLPFHANMFQAAVSASVPVQPLCIMYEDAQGRQSTAPAYIDDLSLADSLNLLLRGGPLTAHVYVGAPLAPGADRRTLAAEAEGVIAQALRQMQSGAAVSGAVIVERGATPASTVTSIELADQTNQVSEVDQSGRSA